MGHGSFKPIALVVEDDLLQRELAVVLLEESEMGVVECESAEEALHVLEKMGEYVSMIFTDVSLAGKIDGVELAHFREAVLPGRPRDRNLGSCANKKPARRRDIHAEAMAPAQRAARGPAFTALEHDPEKLQTFRTRSCSKTKRERERES
jgi:hypothetical protein